MRAKIKQDKIQRGSNVLLYFVLFSFLSQTSFSANGDTWLVLKDGSGYLSGYLGASASKNKNDFESDSNTSLIGYARQFNLWNGFISRPWISGVQLSSTLEADYNQYNANEGDTNKLLKGQFISLVSLYPTSHYPTLFTFDQTLEKNVSSYGSTSYTTVFKAENEYKPADVDYRLNTRYQLRLNNLSRDSIDDDQVNDSNRETDNQQNYLSVVFQDSWENSDYTLSSYFQDEDYDYGNTAAVRQEFNLIYDQNWFLDNNNSLALSANHTTEKDEDSTILSEEGESVVSNQKRSSVRDQITLTSFLNSAENEKLSYTANGFISRSEGEYTDSTNNTVDKIATLSTSVRFEYSETVNFSGSLNANVQNSTNVKQNTFQLSASAEYQDEMDLTDTLNIAWYVYNQSNVSYISNDNDINNGVNDSEDDTEKSTVITVGDTFNKAIDFADYFVDLSLSQSLSHELSSREKVKLLDNGEERFDVSELLLTHDMSMSVNSKEAGENTTLFLQVSDSRHLTDDTRTFQQVYLSLMRSTIMGDTDNWGGSFNYSWDKSTENSEEDVQTTAYGELWYRNTELWGEPNLRFTTKLYVPFNDLLASNEYENNDLANWTNDFNYRIGLLETSLSSTVTENSYNISFDVKRHF